MRIAACALAAALLTLMARSAGQREVAAPQSDAPWTAAVSGSAEALPDRPALSLVRFDPQNDATGEQYEGPADDFTGSVDRASAPHGHGVPGPDINRAAKGDFLIPRVQLDILNEAMRPPTPAAESDADIEDLEAAARYQPFPEYDVALSLELHPRAPADGMDDPVDGLDMELMFGAARVYFDPTPVGVHLAALEPFPVGEAPVLLVPATVANAPDDDVRAPKPDQSQAEIATALHEISPAERLRLYGKTRARAARCLANAVYFEARSESVRGQIAVAQVVLNRAFSGFYPRDVCGVVYQGAHRHLSCQFTFACDGIPDVVTEPAAWARAQRIANATLDGKVWLSDVGHATHYHAYWVHPSWTRSMRRLQKIGVHSFYRPRRWGDGADAPSWGGMTASALAAKL